MARRRIAVTGATGGVGRRVTELLLESSEVHVAALVREPARVTLKHARLDVRRIDYGEEGSLRRALQAVNTLIFVSSDGDPLDVLGHHANVIAALKPSRVEHVVFLSSMDVAADSPFPYAATHRATEALLAETDIPVFVARTSVFTDFFVRRWLRPAAATGALRIPAHGAVSYITRADVSRVLSAAAVHALTGVHTITGPESLSVSDTLAIHCRVAGTPISYERVTERGYDRLLAAQGEPAWVRSAFLGLFRSINQGRFGLVTTSAHALTGCPPMTFEAFLEHTTGNSG